MSNFRLPFEDENEAVESRIEARDRAGRARAVDPRFNVVLEASAGTGKTKVLVDRYLNLLHAGVDPSNILAITFTRKAASEMRERIMAALREGVARGEIPPARWRALRDRMADISISTIDAFCLSLLREFPLEADLDPGFSMLEETEVPRLVDESLDRAMRICRAVAREDDNVALVFAKLGERRLRSGLGVLLHRRIVAPRMLYGYLTASPAELDVQAASRRAATAVVEVFEAMRGGLERFIDSGPLEPAFTVLGRDLERLRGVVRREGPLDVAALQAALARTRDHFMTQDGEARTKLAYAKASFANEADWRFHRDLVIQHGAAIRSVLADYRRDANVLVSWGVWRTFRIAEAEYRRTLGAHAALDYADLLLRALQLVGQMEEFARSRYRLESRYHHVLVDECQDTSRAQWELVSLLVQSWGEGAGLASSGPLHPSIFVVGDRKQSIYGFRDADVSVLGEAARYIGALRADGEVRRSISRSFRSVPALLALVNDVCQDVDKAPAREDAFQYGEEDRFPLVPAVGGTSQAQPEPLGLVVAGTPEECAELTAAEVARLISTGATVRDRESGVPRPIRAADIAILFRNRDSHREFEAALAGRHIPAYVYKGLGFFDADEIKDVLAVLWYLAEPRSNLRAAALMRSRVIRLSDEALRLLAPGLAEALGESNAPDAVEALDDVDARTLREARAATARWRGLVDRIPPAELLDLVLRESGYAFELRGSRFLQARENLKKIRALVRCIQNRGYATLGRIAAHLDKLAVGDEANAAIDAVDAVSLMTVHASKGLEFPVAFLVNLARGTGNRRDPIRIAGRLPPSSVSVAVGDFHSEGDEDARAREREESKRLLYVALTRARDRLYLGATLKEGRIQPGRGSLAEVLPHSLLEQLTAAYAPTGVLQWRAASGQVHAFRTVKADVGRERETSAMRALPEQRGTRCSPAGDDFDPLVDLSLRRVAVATAMAAPYGSPLPAPQSDRLVGALVHRLLQRFGFHDHDDSSVTREAAIGMLRPEEAAGVYEPAQRARLSDEVLAAYRIICGRSDLRALYTGGERLHEVRFSMSLDGTWLRGTIDCLIRRGDRLTVLEFKTGAPRDEHKGQLELYRLAAARIFPRCTIDARLVYAETEQRM